MLNVEFGWGQAVIDSESKDLPADIGRFIILLFEKLQPKI